jgi:sugar/nucleoside kinase (ribokinase family)
MFDVITIGAGTVDLFLKSSQFHLEPAASGVLLCQEYGGKLDIEEFFVQSGGAGTNCAVGFSRLGLKTAAVVEIGKDLMGQVVWDELKREQVDTQFVVTEKGEQTGVSVLLIAQEGGRSALTHRGAAAQLEPRDLPWTVLHSTRWVHLSNVGGQKEMLLRLFDHLSHSLVGLSWNPGHQELELLAKGELQIAHIPLEVLIVNKQEWEVVKEVQAEILGSVPEVLVTDGLNGGTIYLRDKHQLQYQVIAVPVVQETGAGDAFSTGYIAGHLYGLNPQESAEWGKREAASVVQKMGAKTGLLTKHQIENFM